MKMFLLKWIKTKLKDTKRAFGRIIGRKKIKSESHSHLQDNINIEKDNHGSNLTELAYECNHQKHQQYYDNANKNVNSLSSLSHYQQNSTEEIARYNKDLKKGDIIIVQRQHSLPRNFRQIPQHCVGMAQLMMSDKHGHYDSAHVAICTGHNESGQANITHMVDSGYTTQTLDEMYQQDAIARDLVVFRANNSERAQQFANTALNATLKNGEKPKYSFLGPTKTFLNGSLAQVPKMLYLARDRMFCSEFAVAVIQIADVKFYTPACVDAHGIKLIAHKTSPKNLEAYLTKDFCHFTRFFCSPNSKNPGLLRAYNKAKASYDRKHDCYNNPNQFFTGKAAKNECDFDQIQQMATNPSRNDNQYKPLAMVRE